MDSKGNSATSAMSGLIAMSALNLNPSDASTNSASTICATVLSLETTSGLSAIGLRTSHDSITALTIMMARDTTRMTRHRGMPFAMPRDTDGVARRHLPQRPRAHDHDEAGEQQSTIAAEDTKAPTRP